MKIDLREVPVKWATIEKNVERHKKMESMYAMLGFKDTQKINGPIADPYTVGIAETHIQGVSHDLPLIMMEDDAQETVHWSPILEVPDDCDAVYLGTSWYGMVRGVSTYRGCISSVYDDVFLKPYNMLGIHSVLYISERYRDKVVELLTAFKQNPGTAGCDECISMNLKNYNILGLRTPYFYQQDGHSDEETIKPLEPYF